MKRIMVLGLIIILLFSSCDDGGNVATNTDDMWKSDGVIAPMSAKELVEKLSKLNENTTMSDMINIFGTSPYMVVAANSNTFEYFSGDIKIGFAIAGLFDERLYHVVVSCGDYTYFELDLEIKE